MVRLRGRVIDEEQQPVSGAAVHLSPGNSSAMTDPCGEFEFADIPAGNYSVAARKDDLYSWPEFARAAADAEPVVLHARLGSSLIMRVFGARAPIVGAELVLDETTHARTDTTGTLTIRGLAPRDYEGTLSAQGWAQEDVHLHLLEDPGGVMERYITLQRGARIDGVVLGPFGKRVAGIRVWCSNGQKQLYRTTSDAEGRWHVDAQAGTYRVFPRSTTYTSNEQISVECDGRSPIRDLVLRVLYRRPTLDSLARVGKRVLSRGKSERIAGTVLDERRKPVGGARVHLADTSEYKVPIARVRADSHGRFDFEGIAPGEYELVAGWSEPSRYDEWSVNRRVQTGNTQVTVTLPAGGTVTGRVVMDGKPLPYYGVSLTPPRHFGCEPIGIRAADGRFALPFVAPGTWQLVVIGPGTRVKLVEGIGVERGQHVDVGDIAVERGHRVTGHVRDRSGIPVANARVVIGSWSDVASAARGSRLQQWFQARFETATDPAGAYAFEGIDAISPMRAARIWASHPEAGASLIRDVPESDATIDFTLLGFGRIEGAVHGLRGGHAMALATRADEPKMRLSQIDKEGRFQFDDLPPGDYVVTLTGPKDEELTAANVTVRDDEMAHATITMTSTSVLLTIRVPIGRSKDLLIEPTSVGAGIGDKCRMVCVMSPPGREDEERCSFNFVRPGGYRISLDGQTWTPLAVGVAPAEQTIDMRHLK